MLDQANRMPSSVAGGETGGISPQWLDQLGGDVPQHAARHGGSPGGYEAGFGGRGGVGAYSHSGAPGFDDGDVNGDG